ncbi:MAG: sugar transferase [Patescibacteria group bacterium]
MLAVEISPYFFSREKRIFDILVSIFLLALLVPLFLIISILIIFTSGFPIFFIQDRIGRDKKRFKIIKFRTMYPHAHKDQKKYWKLNESPFPAFKLADDPRFVGIGKWLSKTGLDELPQLINILRGEMSLIGPRPLPPLEAKKMTGSWDFRYKVRPGVISLWALSDKRHKSLKHWQRLEIQTLKKANLLKDFLIIFQSIKVPLKNGRNHY